MLKLLSSTCLQSRFQNLTTTLPPTLRHGGTESSIPLLRVLNSLRGLSRKNPNLCRRAFFCSDSTDGSEPVVEAEGKAVEVEGEEADSKASSAIVPTNPRPEDYLTVLALPLPHRPLFPGFYMPIFVKDSKLLAALVESRKRQAPYAGAFLLKDEPGGDPNLSSSSETEKNINDIKGKELFNRLHEVGTLAQISSIQGDQVVLIGHRRLRITEMVSEDPLTVKVDHLKDKEYNKDDDVIKATSFEVISTLRDVLKTSSLWRDHVQTYTQHIGDFNYPRLADFGAAISGANKLQLQEVLEELDVYKRLKLTLQLVKKEMEISKIQESIAKAIEGKISSEQRRYLLNEQLKAIKKELGLETDDKTTLSAKFRERLEPNEERCPPHVLQVIEEELTKLQLLEASSSEFSVTRNYLDWLTALPWGNYRFISSSDSTSTSSISDAFDVARVSELIKNQHWSKLKTQLKDLNPNLLLQRLFDSGADSEVILRYFKWSQREYRVSHSLELSCRLLHSLVNAKNYRKIRAFLNEFVKNSTHSISLIFHTLSVWSVGICANSVIVDMLVLAYVKNSRTDSAIEAFKRAGDYGFRLSALSCNPMLSSLVKDGKIGVVEFVYKEMIKRRIEPDVCTFNIVINGLCKVGKLQKAEDVVEDMKAWGFSPSVITYNTLIDGYCKMGRAAKMYKADALLKEMESKKIYPNEITFNILIDGFCKDENVSAAMEVFKEMQRQGLKPGVLTYNSLINGLCSSGKLDEALGLRDEMLGAGLKPGIVTYNALINGFSKKKMLKEARELFDDIAKEGLAPSVITFNTLIDANCKAGRMDEAIALRSLMLDSGVCPNVATYNCLIAGFYGEGNTEAARNLLNEMKDKSLESDLVTYNILVDALCKKKESRKAARLLDEMFDMGLGPSHITYNTLMDGYCREGNIRAALNVRTRMEKEGKRANVVTYNVLIKGLCQKGKLEEANGLLNEMLEKGLIPNRTTYEIVREEMLEKGFVPDIEGHIYNISVSS